LTIYTNVAFEVSFTVLCTGDILLQKLF